ncbi:hypothetical protein Y032_0013g1980 [Ancylostoma ceylanicum]|uniref:Uncharacterized protein n=1 Tax=Ancylostoma ceylanicum TaxID=53326 RepID=A0A016VC47_9BILA|nr:hypothetical protein Y032_0013g1980 [Ancylostoma ceylanicum]
MVEAWKIRYNVIGLTEARRHRPLNAYFVTGEARFFGTCVSRGVGGVSVLVGTNSAMDIDSLNSWRPESDIYYCGSMPASTSFVAYALRSSCDEKRMKHFTWALRNSTEKTTPSKKVVVNTKVDPRRTSEDLPLQRREYRQVQEQSPKPIIN